MLALKCSTGRLHQFYSLSKVIGLNPFKQQLQWQHTDIKPETNPLIELELPFAQAKLGTFFQDAPQLGNQYLEDSLVQAYLKRYVPKEALHEIEPDLIKFGQRVATEMHDLHLQCEKEQPYVDKYTAWGKRIDCLVTSPAWRKMHDIAAEEGLIAISYDRKYGESSRLYGLVKNYLNSPSSGLYSCPLAMTDGAAKIIETFQDKHPWLVGRAYSHLMSRSPDQFWTSGQWMTEKRGGSDVANGTETVAVPQSDGTHKLYGYKWFSSATDADITFTLARIMNTETGSLDKKLSLFYAEVRKEDGSLNNMEIIRLKNKLGTRQLPTAELLLTGTQAMQISPAGQGISAISDMLTITRIHNALAAAASMRRMVNLARDYSTRRAAFGKILKNYPLHIQTMARMEVETRGAVILCLENMRLLGKDDIETISDQEKLLLRLLVPLSKLYSGKQVLSVCTEGLECFGGQGYIEDTGIPGMLRDAQVLSIWEGTTNILSLDVLRAIAKTKGEVIKAWASDIDQRLSNIENSELKPSVDRIKEATNTVIKMLQTYSNTPDLLEVSARDLSYSLCRIYTEDHGKSDQHHGKIMEISWNFVEEGALLIDHANSEVGTPQDVFTAQRWCEKDLCLVNKENYKQNVSMNFDLVFDGYHDKSRL